MELKQTAEIVTTLMEKAQLGNIAIRVGRNDEVLAELYRSKTGEVDSHTLFDMASVTKILAVTALSLIALDRGVITLEDRVSRFFDYDGSLTVKHLLTHTMGIGHKNLCAAGVSYDNVGEYILSIPADIPIGSNVLYSCPGFILMGKILEKCWGKRLDVLFRELVAEPLQMHSTAFLPDVQANRFVNSNPAPADVGKVNDYNCRYLGGVAGNAGIFSCIDDLTRYAHMLLNRGAPLFSEKTWTLATQNHTPGMDDARGLGYLYVDGRYAQTGKLFPTGSIGHCGHTGQSLFADPKSGLYVIILSDATLSVNTKFGGVDNYGHVMAMREALHNAIQEDLRL